MLVGRFVAYVDDDLQNEFEQFCRGWRSLSSRIRDFRTCSSSSALAFQWKAVRELCAGCEPESESEDADLRQKLAIPKVMWRTPGPIDCTQLYFSERLTARSIENACFPEMRPLSAFDARQWKWVTRGWEVKEYFDRRSELRRRQSELTSLERRWKSDSERLNFETAERLRAWSDIEAERRTRRWRGWW
jgi:hypothetical protein